MGNYELTVTYRISGNLRLSAMLSALEAGVPAELTLDVFEFGPETKPVKASAYCTSVSLGRQ